MWPRRLAFALLGLLALLVAGALAGYGYLTSEAGSALIRQQVLEATAGQFKGRLELAQVHVTAGTVDLAGLKLFTPEGELVAEVGAAHLKLSLLALAHSQVAIDEATLDTVSLWLLHDERGLNLTRALEAKVPSAPGGSPASFDVQLRALRLEKGAVEFRSGEQRYAAQGLSATGQAGVKGPGLRVDASLELHGELTAPLAAPLALTADSTAVGPGDERSKVRLTLGAASLDAELRWPSFEATIAKLSLPPEVLRAFAPGSHVKPALEAKGFVSLERADLAVQAGAANATVKAAWKLEGPAVEAFELSVTDVDLAQLLEGGRPSRLTAKASGRLTDSALATLDGALRVDGHWSTPEGAQLARVDVDATAAKGAVKVERFDVTVPGATLAVAGRGTSEVMSLAGQLHATDLQQVAKAVGELTGAAPPRLAGAGELELAVRGPLLHPGVTAKGRFPSLAVGDLRLTELTLDASVADVRRPLESDGTLFVKRLQAGSRSFDDVSARVITNGRELDVELSTKGLANLVVRAEGEFDRDAHGLALSILEVEYPEARWELAQPTRLDFPPGALTLEPLTLKSGAQLLTASAHQAGSSLTASLEVKALEVGRLPAQLVPADAHLEGQLELMAHASGRLPRPDVEAHLKLRGARAFQIRQLTASLDGIYAQDRLEASFALGSDVGQVKATYSGAVEGALAQRAEPISAHVEVEGVELQRLAEGLQAQWPVTGQLTGQLTAGGTAAAPEVTLHLQLSKGSVVVSSAEHRTVPIEALSLDVAPVVETRALAAHLRGRVFSSNVEADLKTPLTLVGLWAHLPTVAELRALPLQWAAALDGVDLAEVRAAHLVDDEGLAGRLSLALEGTGSLDAPVGQARVGLAKVKVGPLLPLDGALSVVGTRDDTRVKLTLTRPLLAAPVLALEGRALAPLERFGQSAALPHITLSVDGNVGPFTVSEVLEPGLEGIPPKGEVKAQVSATGTPSEPTLRLRGTLDGVALGKVPLGKAGFALDYDRAVSTLSMSLASTGGGVLKAHGTLGLNLSQPSVLAGLDWRAAPVQLTVDAQRFDLGFLSGAVPTVRTLGGLVTANASVSQTLGAPALQGSLLWTDGRLGVAGYGDYRDVTVSLEGSNQKITVKQLEAHNSGGSLKFEGEAKVTGKGFYELRASGSTDKFPLITDDQLRAIVTVQTDLQGELNDELIDLRPVRISKATVELPDVKSKDLQSLDRPAGIVLVKDGVPTSRAERKRLKDAAAAAAGRPVQKGRAIRVLLDAPRNLWVKSSDVNIELGLSEGFRVEVADTTQISGEALLLQGRIDVLGRRFDVQKNSSVRFSGPATLPYLNVTATHVNEREGVTVFATLVGRGKDFSLKTSSTPPLSDSEIFTLLATGRRDLKRGGSATITAESAVSVVGSLAASQLKSALSKKLPLDVLSVEAGSEGLKGTRIETGKYLTDSLYLGYQLQYGADPQKGENTNAGKLEYQFTPRWGLEAYGGDAGAFGADVMWSREY